MSDSAAVDLQKVIVEALCADVALQGALTQFAGKWPVYDWVPDALLEAVKSGAEVSYITVGPAKEQWAYAGEPGGPEEIVTSTHTLSIAAFSLAPGFTGVKALVTLMRDALRKAFVAGTLAIADHKLVTFDPTMAEYMRLDDGATSCGVLTVRALTQFTS